MAQREVERKVVRSNEREYETDVQLVMADDVPVSVYFTVIETVTESATVYYTDGTQAEERSHTRSVFATGVQALSKPTESAPTPTPTHMPSGMIQGLSGGL